MSAPVPPDAFTVIDATLHDLVTLINDQHLNDEVDASLIRVRPMPDGLEVGLRPLEGDHPALWLTGVTLDDDIDAIGVVTGGRLFSLDDPSATIGRTSIAVLVSRRGEVASASVDASGETRSGDLTGIVVDLLKRTLRVPTDPPPCEPDVYFASLWLGAITAFVDAEERLPSWEEIVQLHPAGGLLQRVSGNDLTADTLRPICRAVAKTTTWKLLRGWLDDGRLEIVGINPGEGAWFDDGSFARRLLAERRPLRHLRTEVRSTLPLRLWNRVALALDDLDIPHTCWPDPILDLSESA